MSGQSKNGASGLAETKAEDLIDTSLNLDEYIRELKKLESKDQEFRERGVLVSVQKLLEKAGRKRRGKQITRRINTKFTDARLIFEPAFDEADYYGQVRIRPQKLETRSSKVSSASEDAGDELAPRQTEIMLSALKEDSADFECLALGISPLDALEEMVQRGYSKMPLFWDINQRTSFIGTVRVSKLGAVIADAYATPSSTPDNKNHPNQENIPQLAAEDLLRAVETGAKVVSTSERLDDWVQEILDSGYIYGKDSDGNIVQIYTRSDIGTYMHRMANAFIRVQNLEEVIRAILLRFADSYPDKDAFDRALKQVKRGRLIDVPQLEAGGHSNKSKTNDDCEDRRAKIDDLTFADYIKWFGSPEFSQKWKEKRNQLEGIEISEDQPSESTDQKPSPGADKLAQGSDSDSTTLSEGDKEKWDRLILDLEAVRLLRNELMHGRLKEAIGEELIVLDCLSKGLDAMFPDDILHDQ